ncbi:MAG TPA: hypothetical protein VMO17_16160 [Terriglobia bacterium]|nr:hypothetical protein [Terriglobia bacterium]
MIIPISAEAMIKSLEARVANLEKALQVSPNQVVLQAGTAKVTLTHSGNVQITAGGTAQLSSAAETQIKAAGKLILKGSTIEQN